MRRHTILLIINRNIVFSVSTLIIFIATITLLPSNTIISVMNSIKIRPLDNKIIVIDPGHGGIDGGTNKVGVLEKDINLIVGLKLKSLLIKKGANVIMTREIDDSLDDGIIGNGSRHREDLEARAKIINNSNADIFISTHVNYSKNPKKIGPIAYYYKESKTGRYFAEHMQEYLNDISTYKKIKVNVEYGAIPSDYYILINTTIPGIIVEMGFLSNEIDTGLLLDSDHQNEIVEKITRGIINYFKDDNVPTD